MQKSTNTVITGYPFVAHVDQNARPIINLASFGETLNSDSNIKQIGCYKSMGYLYDLRPHLRKYLIKQYGSWSEQYATNKTNLRKSTYGVIDKIIDITDL